METKRWMKQGPCPQGISILEQGLANFLLNNQMVNILGFVGHRASDATTWFYHYSEKATIDNM